MCGIVGYIGKRQASPILLDGLRRLEYRGYDSAGMALNAGAKLDVLRRAGRIENLRQLVAETNPQSDTGISHTRWATHGAPTDENAHPHRDQSGKLALVHNGVIENYITLRDGLKNEKHTFTSETDTEVLAHLVGHYFDLSEEKNPVQRLVSSVQQALARVKGTYGIAVMHVDAPDVIVGARLGSPLVVGLGQGEHFLASDVSAIVAHTRDVIYLNDYDVITLRRDGFDVQSLEGGSANVQVSRVDFTEAEAEKGDFAHFMLKEIYEQPTSLRNAHHLQRLRHGVSRGHGGRVSHGGAGARADGGGDRERIPLPQSTDDAEHAPVRHQPERRDD
jgi:glucosamine--fructose-6-phosphate aminotransferase (isomerizing)